MKSTRVRISAELLEAFASLSGDYSSIHMNSEVARLSRFRQRVMHGMLPILYFGATGKRLKRLRLHFRNPCFLGDEIQLEQVGSRLRVQRGSELLTEGEIELEEDSTLSRLPAARHPRTEERQTTLDDLRIGRTENLPLQSGDIPQDLADIFASHADRWLSPHPSFVAALGISTMVGMRLPGRLATLSEIEVNFCADPRGDLTVVGRVDKIMGASSRLKLGLSWLVDGQTVGVGHAWSVVDLPPPIALSSREIQAGHQVLGLHGKVALVTGASRGIGEATARLLALQGARVAVHYFQGCAAAAQVVHDIESLGGSAVAVSADIRSEDQVERLFAAVEADLGEVDILVNNAVDRFSPREYAKLSWQDYSSEIEVSLRGMHACSQRALPGMRRRRWGKIINLGSIAVEVPAAGLNSYITVKSALTGYTRSLALEVAPDNVQVNLVVPQMTRTSLLTSLPNGLVQRLTDDSPAGALLEPIQVAQAIVFLASDWARAISGQKLVLNQGMAPFL